MNSDNKVALQSFTALVARRAKVSGVEADAYIHQLAGTMGEELETGGDIHLYRFGRFHTTHIDEQAGHDPNSGEPLTIPEHSRVHFRPYKALRYAVNEPFRQLRIKELTPDKSRWRIRNGAWLLLALLMLLLIIVGIGSMFWTSTQDPSATAKSLPSIQVAEAAPPEVVPNQAVAAQIVQPLAVAPLVTIPAAPVGPEPTPITVARTTGFVVSTGDRLWAIAATGMGDSSWWPVIYTENRPELSRRNPDLIDSGITLRIPVLAGSVDSPGDADLALKANSYRVVADDYRLLGNPRAAAYERAAARLSRRLASE